VLQRRNESISTIVIRGQSKLILRKGGQCVALALMRALFFSSAAFLLVCANLRAAEVQVGPPKAVQTASPQASATPATTMPQYRPALLGTGPASVINRIDVPELIRKGQKDATLLFCCSVRRTGEIANTWIYRQSPESTALEQEAFRCLDTAVFVPAVYNHETVHVLFFGTVNFKVVNGKPRLRIFANQEAEELAKESDFVGPQPFVGSGSKFEGLHYPGDLLTQVLSGLVELAMKIDADGKLQELKLVSEHPPLAGFGRAAAEDFRVATFIPAFREGKPVECSITLPVYYEP
jgi:Gram-negative bacterial TonB protein C-terminal